MNKATLIVISCALVFGALVLFTVSGAIAQNNNAASTDVNIDIRDYCDPASFNAAIGPGTCERGAQNPLSNGAITFPGFVAEVNLDKSVGAWRFVPQQVQIAEGGTLHLQSLGGETHTFTEVKRFGGGFVAFLNAASGNPVPAPECAQMVAGQLVPQPPGPDNLFIAPGTTATVTEHQGVARYQCCIHPWMRLTITPKDQHHSIVQ
jgi:plastocyanin